MGDQSRKLQPVFASDDDWQNNACLNWSHDPIELYATGYKKAADKLVEHVISMGCDQDTLIYPLVFLYRQYIELRLKETIREGRILLEKGSSFPKHHKISDLWNIAKQLAIKVFENNNESPDLTYADHVIKEFAQIDPDSFTFRYPTKKDGEKNLIGVTHINIRQLANHVNELAKDLDSISLGISVYREWQQEMRSHSAK